MSFPDVTVSQPDSRGSGSRRNRSDERPNGVAMPSGRSDLDCGRFLAPPFPRKRGGSDTEQPDESRGGFGRLLRPRRADRCFWHVHRRRVGLRSDRLRGGRWSWWIARRGSVGWENRRLRPHQTARPVRPVKRVSRRACRKRHHNCCRPHPQASACQTHFGYPLRPKLHPCCGGSFQTRHQMSTGVLRQTKMEIARRGKSGKL